MSPAAAPRCPSCDHPVGGRTARFCGACGVVLPPSRPRSHRLLLVTLVVGLAAVGAGLRGAAPSSTGEGPSAGVDVVDVPAPATPAMIGATCRSSDRTGGPCGPTVAVDPDAVLVALRADDVVVAADGVVSRVALPSGAVEWRSEPFPARGPLALTLAGEVVLVGRADEVAALAVADGRRRWRTALSSSPSAGPSAPPDLAVVGAGVLALDGGGGLTALDVDTGTVRWRRADAGTAATTTPHGLITATPDALQLWHPDAPTPRWVRPHDVAWPRWAPETVGLLPDGDELLDPRDGQRRRPSADGPTRVRWVADTTLVLHWPTADGLTVSALAMDGSAHWVRTDLPIRCCLATPREVGPDRIAFQGPGGPAVVVAADDGTTVDTVAGGDGRLVARTGSLVVHRTAQGLVGTHRRTGREVFRAAGDVVSVAPLLLRGPAGTVAVTRTTSAPPDIGRPGPR